MKKLVHTAVYDSLADWEVGFATAHINNPSWQRETGRFSSSPSARAPSRSPRWGIPGHPRAVGH